VVVVRDFDGRLLLVIYLVALPVLLILLLRVGSIVSRLAYSTVGPVRVEYTLLRKIRDPTLKPSSDRKALASNLKSFEAQNRKMTRTVQ
jgi:hypothetical protein